MELNHSDIQNLIVIIDLATQRGVFKASDLASVGSLYEKLISIDKELKKKAENQTDSAQTA
jgi:hypothetical protein